MKELLEKWVTLEPTRCKIETCPNQEWRQDFEYFYIAIQTGDSEGWQLVYSDSEGYFPDKNEALGRVQWAVQQAIIEKSWYYELLYRPQTKTFRAEVANIYVWEATPTEALLKAYINALESGKNDNQP